MFSFGKASDQSGCTWEPSRKSSFAVNIILTLVVWGEMENLRAVHAQIETPDAKHGFQAHGSLSMAGSMAASMALLWWPNDSRGKPGKLFKKKKKLLSALQDSALARCFAPAISHILRPTGLQVLIGACLSFVTSLHHLHLDHQLIIRSQLLQLLSRRSLWGILSHRERRRRRRGRRRRPGMCSALGAWQSWQSSALRIFTSCEYPPSHSLRQNRRAVQHQSLQQSLRRNCGRGPRLLPRPTEDKLHRNQQSLGDLDLHVNDPHVPDAMYAHQFHHHPTPPVFHAPAVLWPLEVPMLKRCQNSKTMA